jgi:hypothetical protein
VAGALKLLRPRPCEPIATGFVEVADWQQRRWKTDFWAS